MCDHQCGEHSLKGVIALRKKKRSEAVTRFRVCTIRDLMSSRKLEEEACLVQRRFQLKVLQIKKPSGLVVCKCQISNHDKQLPYWKWAAIWL